MRFCFYGEAGSDAGMQLFYPKSDEVGTFWQGSGSAQAAMWWDPVNELFRLSCPTEGGIETTPMSVGTVADDTWHQVTLRFDSSVNGTATCQLWVDKDSDETPDIDISNSGMDPSPGNLDGMNFYWARDNTGMHFDFIQVDDTETDLVDVYGGDCRP
jgi:hypothetical protein